jgi:hypothetical protein
LFLPVAGRLTPSGVYRAANLLQALYKGLERISVRPSQISTAGLKGHHAVNFRYFKYDKRLEIS